MRAPLRSLSTARTVALSSLVVLALGVGVVGAPVAASAMAAATQPAAAPRPAATNVTPDFYAVPDPLPAGAPGAVIKTDAGTPRPGVNGTIYRVMYHSQSVGGADIPVTGTITVPNGTPPAGGWPVVTWAHGTTGLADVCAPSKNLDTEGADFLVGRGYEVVATDYEGLGTPGRHPYIVGISEGRGVLDIVRAARNLALANASDRVLIWGHSQGGHAALWAGQIAAAYAPELHVVGTVAGAPPSQLQFVYQALKTSFFRYYLIMAAAGINAAYPNADLSQVLTADALAKIGIVDTACGSGVGAPYAGETTDQLIKADPSSVEPWKSLIAAQEPGTVKTNNPILIIQGGNDEQIPVASSILLENRMCSLGQVVQRRIYPGQTHAGVIAVADPDMAHWIDDRFAGISAPDDCNPVKYLAAVTHDLSTTLDAGQKAAALQALGRPTSPAAKEHVVTAWVISPQNARATVELAYQDVLGRPGDTAGLDYWMFALIKHGKTINDVIAAMATSPEFLTHLPPQPFIPGVDPQINVWYVKLLGRGADAAGSQYWVAHFPGALRNQVPLLLLGSSEGRAHRAGQLFQRFLNRTPNPATANAFGALLKQFGEPQVVVELLKSWEYDENAQSRSF